MKELYFSNLGEAKELGFSKANSLQDVFKMQFSDYEFYKKSIIQFRAKEGYKERHRFNEIDLDELFVLYSSIEEQIQEMELNLAAAPLGEEIFLGDYSYQGFENPLDRYYPNEELYELEGLRLDNLLRAIKEKDTNYSGVVSFKLTKENLSPYTCLGLVKVQCEKQGENIIHRYFRSEKTSLEIISELQNKFAKQYAALYFKAKAIKESEFIF